jgi:hypothetical protein
MGPPRSLPRLTWRRRAVGHPATMRRLAALAVQAAIQAEEEAAWQARVTATAPTEEVQVA